MTAYAKTTHRRETAHSRIGPRTGLQRWLAALLLVALLLQPLAPLVAMAAPPSQSGGDEWTSGAEAAIAANNVQIEANLPQSVDSLLESLVASSPTGEYVDPARASFASPAVPALTGLAEIPERRSAYSALFRRGAREYTAILGAEPLHYRDADGRWQVIDPTFSSLADSFTVQHNAIQTRAGLYQAWLSAVVEDTAILWETQTLGASRGSQFTPLAHTLEDPEQPAQRQAGGHVLRYEAHWSEASLAEEFHSTHGSMEHIMVLAEPLHSFASEEIADGDAPDFLELRAELQLLPGAALWADGEERRTAFRTTGALEIRNTANTATMVLDPVFAFEQAQPHVRVAGEYSLHPGEKPGLWIIGVRTPWQWWIDEARQYPAVIDPTIRVNRSTGYGDGIAWLNSTGGWNFHGIILGSPGGAATETNGYVQFNSLPGLLSNAPVQIKQAFLDVEPAGIYHMPFYEHPKGDYPDWEHHKIQRTTELFYVGACPDEAACNGLSLQNSAPANNWNNRPIGQPLAAGAQKELVAGPLKPPGGSTTVTTWDVTQELANWYDQWYDNPGYPKPTFRVRFKQTCTFPGPYVDGGSAYIPACTTFNIPAGNVRLRIDYQELPLAVNDNLLNFPGVPGYLDGVLEDTAHQYDLATPAGFNHWRGVAVRGNHAFAPGPVTRAGLRLVDETGSEPVLLTTASTASAEETAFVLIDEHNEDDFIGVADLKALVTASNENNLPVDPERNYRIHHHRAQEHTVPIGDWYKIQIAMDSLDLLNLHEFHLDYGDKLAIRAVLTTVVDIVLVEPTHGPYKQDAVLGNNDSRVNRGFQPTDMMTRTLSLSAPRTGIWALGLVNQAPPIPRIPGVTGALHLHQGYVEILRCPQGTIPTDKWKCQPLRLPDDSIPESRTVDGLTIYSEGGFISRAGGGDSWCTANEGSGAPIIGPSQNGRWAFVGQGSVCYIAGTGELYTTADSSVGLAVPIASTFSSDKRGDYPPTFIFGDTAFSPLPDGMPHGETVIENNRIDVKDDEGRINIRPFHEHWNEEFETHPTYIDLGDITARSGGWLYTHLSLGADAEPFNVDFNTGWNLFPNPDAGGQTNQPLYTFNTQIAPNAALPIPMDMASLSVRIMQDGTDTPDGRIKHLDSYLKAGGPSAGNLRADSARVTQDEQLGGATQLARVIVQPPGLARQPDNEKSCFWDGDSTSCLDLRVPEYSWANGDGEKVVARWRLPDIHLTDQLGTMMINTAGQLTIFSVDHPRAANVSQSFSFDTWGATVSVAQEPCMEGEPETVVVRGQGLIAMPNVGDDGSAPPSIEVSFKLCETNLRQAKLVFAIPAPGIPVGSTGVGVNMIGGEVTVGTDSVQITIEIGFQTMDGTTLKNGKGVVTIDTAGLFALQASGKIVSVLDAYLHLQVAWNPLDLLFEAEVGYKGLIEGGLRMHAWIGQGWQNKYSWLPDNDDFHFTGMIWATLNIKAGMVVDEGIFKLPPFSFSLTLTISFGEFCTNPSCTTYAWGMSATLSVMGYAVGMYVDNSGPSLILGTNNHKLIDQFGGGSAQYAAVAPAATHAADLLIIKPGMIQQLLQPVIESPANSWPTEQAADACTGVNTTVHTCSFTVDPATGRALFAAGWQNGNLGVSLIKPDNTIIQAGNALNHGVVYSSTNDGLVYHVSFAANAEEGQTLMPGEWKLQLSNVGVGLQPGFDNNYRLLYASDPPAPIIQWNTPATPGVTPGGNGLVTLEWNATRGGQPLSSDVRLELFYTPVATKPITPTDMAGNIIVNGLSAAQGSYAWDTRGLASGEYAVGARVDDRQHGNGHVVAWAPGSITVVDMAPPPVPKIAGTLAVQDGLLVAWHRDNVTPDLAGYLVEYTIPDWNFSAASIQHIRRVTPRSKFKYPLLERVRLGGMLPAQATTVCVRAYDASGNVSDCEEFTVEMPREPAGCRLGQLIRLDAARIGRGEVRVIWAGPDCGAPDGYLIDYRPIGCFVPGLDRSTEQSPPTVVVDNPGQTDYILRGLTDFQTYQIGVRAYTNNGDISPERFATIRLIDPTDTNGNGLPDGWEALYGVSNPDADTDGDGLTDREEFELGTDPTNADSDEDGFYDSEEVDWGTDPCGPETPPYHQGPKLQVSGPSTFVVQAATNLTLANTATWQVFNMGGDEINWRASASASWIKIHQSAMQGPGVLEVEVDAQALAPGVHRGVVYIRSEPDNQAAAAQFNTSAAVSEEVAIEVRAEVLPPKMEETPSAIYLPTLHR